MARVKLPKYIIEKRKSGFYGIKLDGEYVFDHFFSEDLAKDIVKALKREYRRGFRDNGKLNKVNPESEDYAFVC